MKSTTGSTVQKYFWSIWSIGRADGLNQNSKMYNAFLTEDGLYDFKHSQHGSGCSKPFSVRTRPYFRWNGGGQYSKTTQTCRLN